MLVQLVLGGYAIGVEPIWVDEGATWLFAQRSLFQLWTVDLWSETNPPAYYSLMRLWVGLFGDSPSAMRSLSLVASCLSLVPIYLIVVRLTRSAWTASLTALGVATSPAIVYYSQEARAFSLSLLASMVAVWGLTVLVTHPAASSRPMFRAPAGKSVPGIVRMAWCAYGLGAAAALYFHFTLVFLLMGCTAVAVVCWLFSQRFGTRWITNWVVINLVSMLLATPVFAAFVYHSLYSLDGFWVLRPTVIEGFDISASAYISHLPQEIPGALIYPIVAMVLAGAILLPSVRQQQRLRVGWVLGVCMAVGVPVLVWAISQYKPIMIPRAIHWAIPMLPIGLAVVGYGVLHRYVFRAVMIAIIVIGTGHSVYKNQLQEKKDYGPLVEMAHELGTDETAYYGSSHVVSWSIRYLLRDEPDAPAWTYLSESEPNVSISRPAMKYADAIEQMRRQDDIMLIVRRGSGLEDHIRPGLEETHTFSFLKETKLTWNSGKLYHIQRR